MRLERTPEVEAEGGGVRRRRWGESEEQAHRALECTRALLRLFTYDSNRNDSLITVPPRLLHSLAVLPYWRATCVALSKEREKPSESPAVHG